MKSLETYFEPFRKQIIGQDLVHEFPTGKKRILYADWAASGRLYRPIEEYLSNVIGPYVANTHTETTTTGTAMTQAYHQAHEVIKEHVSASEEDVLLFAGFGMTAVINKFQRILGLRVPSKYKDQLSVHTQKRPLVILTHMEHHSNQTTWEECLCDVELIRRSESGMPDLNHLEEVLKSQSNREIIGSFTACSNVTGIQTPVHQMAEMVHAHGGVCFVDYSASAPYVEMNMHPEKPEQALDAIFFSPHKFLGGPGSSGVIVFNRKLYDNPVPDHPGGGTVFWTNPWGDHRFFRDIEIREDGGTPGFLQAIKGALSVLLKEEMGVSEMITRESELKKILIQGLREVPELILLEPEPKNRLAYVSFFVPGVHHNLMVKLLNDRFGIQTRGGCSCAGTLGHILLHIDSENSKRIADQIDQGDWTCKPGWARISLHPTMTDTDVKLIVEAVQGVVKCHVKWAKDYRFNKQTGDFDSLHGTVSSLDIRSTFKVF
ncbi:aminotransferase class V-fold PLP-dependent enzyme [candidate division KSB1 bacterium]|nr:aminotransferase class V-fold PLP-dependent enzyme [candidate division KSB1 bacterium]